MWNNALVFEPRILFLCLPREDSIRLQYNGKYLLSKTRCSLNGGHKHTRTPSRPGQEVGEENDAHKEVEGEVREDNLTPERSREVSEEPHPVSTTHVGWVLRQALEHPACDALPGTLPLLL